MDKHNISEWPEDMKPSWFQMVVGRVTCPQQCKTVDQACKWEWTAIEMVKSDTYAVSVHIDYMIGQCLIFSTADQAVKGMGTCGKIRFLRRWGNSSPDLRTMDIPTSHRKSRCC
jgi:hypothetical protein